VAAAELHHGTVAAKTDWPNFKIAY